MPIDSSNTPKPSSPTKIKKTEGKTRRVEEETEDELFEKSNKSKSVKSTGKGNKIIAGCVIVALVAVIAVVAVNMSSDKGEKQAGESTEQVVGSGEEVEADGSSSGGDSERPWLNAGTSSEEEPSESEESVEPEKTASSKKEGVVPGIKDISGNTTNKNTAKVEPDTFVKDLNSKKVPENYEAASTYTTIDFISYTKHRAVTGDGIELYWLDAKYKGKKAKVQVPFSIFKELDPVGVTVCDVEVIVVEGKNGEEHEIVTNFQVRPDYKRVLEENKDNS